MANPRNTIFLPPSEIPTSWYNIAADLPSPLPPPLHPGTMQPITPDLLAPIFPMNLIEQEVASERFIKIPEEVLEAYMMWRPTPLIRAKRFEEMIGTPAKIYYKYEGISPAGSHKPNTAIPQAFYNKVFGTKRLATETGAGQWGSSLAFACERFGLDCMVYMVKVSFHQKPYRRSLMKLWGADVIPSPSDKTKAGRDILAKDPDCPGSLGIAISEAIEDAVTTPNTKYSLGSVLNHVLLHQTITGQETMKQFEIGGGIKPDILIGCCGGGSNFAGFVFPFIPKKLKGEKLRIIATEPTACPTLTKGPYIYDFGDTAKTTPLLKMHSLGSGFIPPGIHAGGLRYHGMAPLVSACLEHKLIEAKAFPQTKVFESSAMFFKAEGIVPAPETSHAVRAVYEEALRCKEENKEETIAFLFSGHGLLDLSSYDSYIDGKLQDYEYHPDKQ